MAIDLKAVEGLAADQASLKAAAGLAKPGKWTGTGRSHDGALVWGECAGSGANPYRVIGDLRDLGAKCTCPSRKFPCKHALALFWLDAEALVAFPAGETPDWVSEWVGRRRGGAGKPVSTAPKDLAAALAVDAPVVEDEAAVTRREAASAKRAADTERAILDALEALEQWIGDQLRLGLAGFVDEATVRCRRIAARLVDGKAAVLGGQVDEVPARLLGLPAGDRVRGAAAELSGLFLLARAFRGSPRDPELRRAVAVAENREALLADPATLRVAGAWEVVAERVRTRRDGLVARTGWLLNLGPEGPRFAMLTDVYPASAGRRGSAFAPGEQFAGELAFYPARSPLRAVLVSREAGDAPALDWPAPDPDQAAALTAPLLAEPWATERPVLLPAGRIGTDHAGTAWWRASDGATLLPIAEAAGLATATELTHAAMLWSGGRLELLAARTPWGRIDG